MPIKSTVEQQPAKDKTFPRLMVHADSRTVWLVCDENGSQSLKGVAVGHIPPVPTSPAAWGAPPPAPTLPGPAPAAIGTVRPNLSLHGFTDFHGSITLQNED